MKKFLLAYIFSLIVVLGYSTQYEYNTFTSSYYYGYSGYAERYGQTFTVGTVGTNESFVLDSISLPTESYDANFYVEIYATSAGMPTGSAISATESKSYYNRHFIMTPVALQTGVMYAIVIYSTDAQEGYFGVNITNTSSYSGGQFITYNGSWSSYGTADMQFYVYGKHVPIITSQPTSITRCAGTSATFTVGYDTDTPYFQWRKNGTNITAGGTGPSYTIPSVSTSDAGNYDCVVTEYLLGTSTTSNTAVLTVPETVQLTASSIGGNYCNGSNATFSITVTGSSLTYQWYKDGVIISGSTSNSYSITGITSANAGVYLCAYNSTCGSGSSSGTLTVLTNPSITSNPYNDTICEGGSISLSVTATGSSLQYQWRKDGSNISGATSATYTKSSVVNSDEGVYDVYVSNTCANTSSTDAIIRISDNDLTGILTDITSYWGFDGSIIYSNEIDLDGSNDGTVYNVSRIGSEDYGSQYGYFDGNTDYINLSATDTRLVGTYSFWVYPTDRSDDRIIMGNDPYYSRIFLTSTNGYVRVETNTNGQEFQFNSNAPPLNTWSHVALVRNGDYMSYYFNGTFINTVAVSGANTLSVKQIGYNGRSFRGRIDEVSIHNIALSSAQVSVIYNSGRRLSYNMYANCESTPEPPPITGGKKILLAGKLNNIVLNGKERDFGGGGPYEEQASQDTLKIYFAENFNNFTTASISTPDSLQSHFEYYSGAINYDNQTIVDYGDIYDKVWRAQINSYYTDPTDCWHSFELNLILNDTAENIWMAQDIFVPTSFNPLGVTNLDRHVPPAFKISGGFAMTNDHALTGRDTSSLSGAGGWAHSVGTGWITGEAFNMGYMYLQNPLGLEWSNGYNSADSGYYRINDGVFKHVTRHIFVGDPGQYNGFYEEYVDGVLVLRYTGLKFRSVSQGEDFGKVENGSLSFFLGGQHTSDYASTAMKYIYLDNVIWYSYNDNAVTQQNLPREIGDEVPIIRPINNFRPPIMMIDETYTNINDTIYDTGDNTHYLYNPASMTDSIEKQVILPAGYEIDYTFLIEEFGFPPDEPNQDYYVTVYSGTGPSKTILKKFGRSSRGIYPPYENPSGTYRIYNNSATFVIHTGWRGGDTLGTAIKYTGIP